METILIFTNYNSIKDHSASKHKLSWRLGDMENGKIAELVPCIDGGQFIIAYDGIPEDRLNEIIDFIKEGTTYILYHEIPYYKTIYSLTNKLNAKNASIAIQEKKSNHAIPTTYGCVPEIDNNKNNLEKLKDIFDQLKKTFIDDSRLSFLIQQWKSLALLGIKIKRGSVKNNVEYKDEIRKIAGPEGFEDIAGFDSSMKFFWDTLIGPNILIQQGKNR